MSQSKKKRKQQRVQRQEQTATETEPLNMVALNLINSPNVWTPKIEDAWLRELRKISAIEIYRRFPPLRKPGNVGLRGRTRGG